ncbi:MAG: GH92 family glycosyl hydrolase [Kiritimatiellae bacterium]|nr:GH92 family glycosyl hydrolase [Kiritimatiellia bacterium]
MKVFQKSLMTFALAALAAGASAEVVWQIGTKDGTGNEFALAPGGYADFLKQDFGWEDKWFLVGTSNPKVDFPYVLPGIKDKWAGSGHPAGDRAQQVNILFDLASKGTTAGEWKLVIDFACVHSREPPVLKVRVNGKSHKFKLAKGIGGDETISKGDFSKAKPVELAIPLAADEIRAGANEVMVTSIENSWAIFDDIRLEGPKGAKVVTGHKGAYVRNVTEGRYLVDEKQPLLVDVEHLDGKPEVVVEIDGKPAFKQVVEKGSYSFEVPMPDPVRAQVEEHSYKVFVDGQLAQSGLAKRSPVVSRGVASYVDTRMGTGHSRWMLAPGPWTPFSMVKLGPDNERARWQGGYEVILESVGCFSHIHEWTMAGFGTMPVTGPLKTKIGNPSEIAGHADGYRSYVDKATEVSEAGYYAVTLADYNIRAELTQTDRCGFQRYTYPAGATPRVMLDFLIPAEYNYVLGDCVIEKVNGSRVEGSIRQVTKHAWGGRDQAYTVHFVAEFDHEIAAFGGWASNQAWTGTKQQCKAPKNFGCWAEFKPNGEKETVVQLRTAISYVDRAGAANNLATEVVKPFGWNFELVRAANVETWNKLLGRVQIKTSDAREKKRFYSNMYRSFCSRNTFNDVDGRWMDPLDKVAKLDDPDARAMGCDAFWNTFWNLNQVWNLIGPEWSARWTKSQMAMYNAAGWLAKGPAGMKYIPVMVAEHEIPLMVSTWQMGIHAYEPKKLLEAFVKMQTTPAQNVGVGRAGNNKLVPYLQYHYVPSDFRGFSNSMEYSYDDWTVGQFAQAIGATDVAKTFGERGYWWKNAVNRESGYCHLRNKKGEWAKNFDPIHAGGWGQYTEGNAWQLTYFVPQDVPALAEWIGRDRFIERLDWGFPRACEMRYNAPNERYELYPVVQGNQQTMHFAFLYNWVGQPWKTQKWSRSILERYYGYGNANAWLGDEDQGQMSAWLVMASLGLFQTDGGCRVEPIYEIASPLYEEAVIDLGGRYGRGQTFTVKAHGASRLNMYVQKACLNGEELTSFTFPAKKLLKGGTLELWMGDKPNEKWGVR